MIAETLKASKKMIIPYRRFTFYIIGAGGTGSYLVRDLARIISITNKKYHREDDMVIIDGDEVELKNLSRQNFISNDIGKNKAEILSDRYKNAFGIDISFVPEYINDENIREILSRTSSNSHCSVFIGCVDNNKTRHIIHRHYRRNYNAVISIDSGNEEHGGQVVFSTSNGTAMNGRNIRFVYNTERIKDIVEEFNLDDNDKHPEEMSCAEAAVSAPQNIATNILAANIIFGYCNNMLAGAANFLNSPDKDEFLNNEENGDTYSQRLKHFMSRAPLIDTHISFFNSKTGQISTKPFSEDTQSCLSR